MHGNPRIANESGRRSAWPIVPIQSIVQGELSVLPLETVGSALCGRAVGHVGHPLALPTQALVLPGCGPTGRPPGDQHRFRQGAAIPATLLKALKFPVPTPTPAQIPAPVPTLQPAPVQAGLAQTPSMQLTPALISPSPTPDLPVSAQTAASGMCNAVLEEDCPFRQNNLPHAKPVQAPTVGTVPVKSTPVAQSAPVQRHQSSRAAPAQEVDRDTPGSSALDNGAKENPKGIEAADVMSLLEQFEVTEATEEQPLESSVGLESLEERKLLDHIFGAELASTAGLTPPATPPHQIWKSLPPTGFLRNRKLPGAVQASPGSPLRTVKLIEPKPLPQNNGTKCEASVSSQPVPQTPLTASYGFGDHEYCLPRVLSTQPSLHNICQPFGAQPDVGCRWNVKRQTSITIKPITSLNHRSPSPSCKVLPAEERRVSEPRSDENASGSQETPREAHVSSNSLRTGTASADPGRSCSQAVGSGNVGCDAAWGLEGGHCVTLSPCRNGETGEDKPFDSPQHCPRTLTSPCYRRRRYSSSSSSGSSSRSRSHSPARKRRRYCRRRSRHSRHSSRSDSRSSSRSRSYSRSNSRSLSRSRSRSPQRRSVRMSYFTDDYDPYDEEPRNRYSRREAHEKNSSRRRELAIEERRVVYVGKIRNGMMREELRRRFEVFGEIEDCNIYFRNEGDNYGFVTYRYTCDAFAAIENGQTLRKPDELPFDLCFGGRRQFCKTNYADLDSSHSDFGSYSTKSKFDSLDFDTLLKQAKRSLQR